MNAVGAAERQSGTAMSAKLRQLRNAVGVVVRQSGQWGTIMSTKLRQLWNAVGTAIAIAIGTAVADGESWSQLMDTSLGLVRC